MTLLRAEYKEKLLALVATGMPGLQKILLVGLIEYKSNSTYFTDFAVSYNYLQLISSFCAIGWCGLILSQIPKLNLDSGRAFIKAILRKSMLLYAVCFCVYLLLYYFGLVRIFGAAFVFLFSWMIYQIARHYLLVKKLYNDVLFSDFVSLLVLAIAFFYDFDLFLFFGVGLFIGGGVSLLKNKIFNSSNHIVEVKISQALDISYSDFSNLVGVASLPIMLSELGFLSAAAAVAYMLPIMMIVYLIPRAVGIYMLPELSKSVGLANHPVVFRKYINSVSLSSVISVLFVSCVFFVFVSFVKISALEFSDAYVIFTLLMVYSLFNSIAVAFYNHLICCEMYVKVRTSSWLSAFFVLIIFMLAYFKLLNVSVSMFVFVICSAVIIKLCYLFLSSFKEVRKRYGC